MKRIIGDFNLVIVSILVLLINISLLSQNSSTFFREANIRYEKHGSSPYDIRFTEDAQISNDSFFKYYKEFFYLNDDYEFRMISEFTDKLGQTHYRYRQYYRDTEIIEAQFILHEKNGYIRYANGHLVHGLNADVTPSISEQAALQLAINHIGAESYMWQDPSMEEFLKTERRDTDATYYPEGNIVLTSGREIMIGENYKLVYRFDIYAQEPLGRYYVDVNALTGEIVRVINRIHDSDVPGSGLSLYNDVVLFTADEVSAGTEYRLQEHTTRPAAIETFDMNNTNNYDLAVDITSTSADGPWDAVGINGHWGAEATYDYFFTEFGRNSFDGNGGTIFSYVHFSSNFNNAFWDGERMTYGDGDGLTFTPLVSLDVCGHEVTHGVTEHSADLIYEGESGALNESFSDIFGNGVEFSKEGMPGIGTGSWRIGEDITPDGLGIRNMANPNNFGDPDTYLGDAWAPTDPNAGDNGGVHTNSGVQNFWYYLLSEGGSGVNDMGDPYSVTGIGLVEAGQIAYRNLTAYLTPSSPYFDARLATINSATDLFGGSSIQLQSALDAWDAVGVYHPKINPAVGVPGDTIDFIAEVLVSSDTVILNISNHSISPLIIDDLLIVGDHFQIDGLPMLPVELTNYLDELQLRLTFTPTELGFIVEELQIVSNDAEDSVKTVYLNGKCYEVNPAPEKILFASSGPNNDGNILTINLETGTGTILGWSNFDEIKSLTIDPLSGNMFGMNSNTTSMEVMRVNATGGDSYFLQNFEVSSAASIAFNNQGEFYIISKTGEIYSADLSDGTLSMVTDADARVGGSTFNPFNNELWVTAGLGQNLDMVYKINISTGDTTQIGKTGLNAVTNDIAFDESGDLYGIIGWTSQVGQLVQINTNTGEGTVIGTIGYENILGLAYNPGNVSAVEDKEELPLTYSLAQNYPNPFNPTTKITYQIPSVGTSSQGGNVIVQLKVFNVLGKEVTTLVNEEKPAGIYEVEFSGKNFPSGVYFYRLSAGSFMQTKKMIILK